MSAVDDLRERLPAGAVSTHPGEVGARARDLWALALLRERRGQSPYPPAAVVFPSSTEDVVTVLRWARDTGTAVVPRGAGSGVCGGAEAVKRSVVLDMSRMSRLIRVDETSMAIEVQAGARGDKLEEALAPIGLTLGHYPQSLAISTVGGWVAASSAGQASAGYGAIEDMLLGLTVVLSGGEVLRLRATPRSAAGPDLRRLFVGSEGTFGVVTEAVLSVAKLPTGYAWEALRPPSFETGIEICRAIAQSEPGLLVMRLYDAADAGLAFGALGHAGGPVLILGFAAGAPGSDARRAAARREAETAGATPLDPSFGEHWWEHRNDAVETYRRVMGPERMLGEGVVVDTMEVAALWADLHGLYKSVRDVLVARTDAVGCHLSHPYRSGASLYFTFIARAGGDLGAESRYSAAWQDAVRATHAAGGTMTHHHGVGLLKVPFMEAELGTEALDALRAIKTALDPTGIMNPGKLLP